MRHHHLLQKIRIVQPLQVNLIINYVLKAKWSNNSRYDKLKNFLVDELGKDGLIVNGSTYKWSRESDAFNCKLTGKAMSLSLDYNQASQPLINQIDELMDNLEYATSNRSPENEIKRAQKELEKAQKEIERTKLKVERAKLDILSAKLKLDSKEAINAQKKKSIEKRREALEQRMKALKNRKKKLKAEKIKAVMEIKQKVIEQRGIKRKEIIEKNKSN